MPIENWNAPTPMPCKKENRNDAGLNGIANPHPCALVPLKKYT